MESLLVVILFALSIIAEVSFAAYRIKCSEMWRGNHWSKEDDQQGIIRPYETLNPVRREKSDYEQQQSDNN